jgi:site-specific recombinase XerD
MARIGLRVGEVAQITLDDIDWQAGTLSLPMPKGRRQRILPLPQEVGNAIVAYLRKGRPLTNERHIFVSHRPPAGTALNKDVLRQYIRCAFIRAGLDTPSKGTRILRHTAATQLIRTGATMKEIADVLGHSSIDTTCIYAKVDIPSLKEVAMPWPKEARR